LKKLISNFIIIFQYNIIYRHIWVADSPKIVESCMGPFGTVLIIQLIQSSVKRGNRPVDSK